MSSLTVSEPNPTSPSRACVQTVTGTLTPASTVGVVHSRAVPVGVQGAPFSDYPYQVSDPSPPEDGDAAIFRTAVA